MFGKIASVLKAPATWIGGIVLACLSAYFSEKIAEIIKDVDRIAKYQICSYNNKRDVDSQKFITVVLAKISGDENGKFRDYIRSIFLEQEGLDVIDSCQNYNVLGSGSLSRIKGDISRVAIEELVDLNASLLIFGEAAGSDKFNIRFANKFNGCREWSNKAISVDFSSNNSDILRLIRSKLLEVILMQITAACDDPDNNDWKIVGHQIDLAYVFTNLDSSIYSDAMERVAMHLYAISFVGFSRTQNKDWDGRALYGLERMRIHLKWLPEIFFIDQNISLLEVRNAILNESESARQTFEIISKINLIPQTERKDIKGRDNLISMLNNIKKMRDPVMSADEVDLAIQSIE